MQTIGERLEEARKRLGISLREASEFTKIRGDYLTQMENGTFAIPLPDVYKRGFLKIYARHLKLDAEKLAADFNAQVLPSARAGRRENRDNLGRIDIAGREGAVADGEEAAARSDTAASISESPVDQATLTKIGIWFGVALLAVGVLFFGLFRMINSSAGTDSQAPAPSSAAASKPATASTPKTAASQTPPAPEYQLQFTAQDDISNVTVWQASDGNVLFTGRLQRGQSVPVTSKGRVKISATATQSLIIVQNGQQRVAGDDKGHPLTGTQVFYWPPAVMPGGAQ